ncbi:MAG: HD-GYP domain-containing protein, partial [Bacillota bacterium]|nr:HD-GYP domain-containing protein [Bacillota bacterium]
TVNAILKTLFQKDSREENHSIRVGELCKLIGHAMGLSRARTTDLALLGMIHDIGKISIDDNIIGKTEKLTSEEYDVIKRHSETGYHIISASPELSYLSEYVLAHHERWDGNGYPNRIIGKDIPLFSRILAVADAYEAITSDRSYHKAKSSAEALAEIKRCSGTQFDPDIVDAFFKLMENK